MLPVITFCVPCYFTLPAFRVFYIGVSQRGRCRLSLTTGAGGSERPGALAAAAPAPPALQTVPARLVFTEAGDDAGC